MSAVIPVPSTTEVTLTSFTTASPYFDNTGPQWNTATGVYTTTTPQSFVITVDISWTEGIDNRGTRILRIYYFPFVGVPQVVKIVETQANPNKLEPTPQIASVAVFLSPGDRVYATVYHDAPVSLSIDTSGTYSGHITNS